MGDARKRRVLAWLLVAGLALPATPGLAAAAGTVRVHSPESARSLQQVIEQAAAGDTLLIKRGIYRESGIVVDKALTIIGEQGAVLDAGGAGQIMTLRADGIAVSGLTFRNAPLSYIDDIAALKLEKVRGARIENNIFQDNFFAIYLAESAGVVVRSNQISASASRQTHAGNGIHLWYCKNVRIEENSISGHRDGIYLEFVEDSEVHANDSRGNLRYGLHFMFSNRCAYTSNTFRENGAGVAVMYTRNVRMIDNRFEDNWGAAAYGLLLKDITDSEVTGNLFRRNSTAIYAESCNRVILRHNRFEINGWAVRIMGNCLDNRFEANRFIANSFDVTTNSRQNFNTFSGNYWDKYRGYDLDRDGLGDIPHRPVSLFSYLVQQNAPSLILMRSFFVDLLNVAEAIMPVLTPKALSDPQPLMRSQP